MSFGAISTWGAFNTVQLISMQPYHATDMPSNAIHFFETIDEVFRGAFLDPSKGFANFLNGIKEKSVPVLKRQLQEVDGAVFNEKEQVQ